MATYLDEILAWHHARARAEGRDAKALIVAAESGPPTRPFAAAVRAEQGAIAVIAEVKRRSPSRGALAVDLDPALLAQRYATGGAACLSVLTDEVYFGGSLEDLAAARTAVDLPVLRKDFTVCELDVYETRASGADAVLLIAAALDDAELRGFAALAAGLGLGVLVEVHDEDEVARALDAGADLIGVNQRDLHTFEVDSARAVRVAKAIPDGVTKVAESGIRGPDDVPALIEAGFSAILVGEALVTSGDPSAALAALKGAGRS